MPSPRSVRSGDSQPVDGLGQSERGRHNRAPGSGSIVSNGAPTRGYYAMPTGSIFPGYSPPSSVVTSGPVSTVSFPYTE